VARDITKRKRPERALRENEERFRIMADTAPVMIRMTWQERRLACSAKSRGANTPRIFSGTLVTRTNAQDILT
jgi:PAS domain-containing protein